MSWTLRTVRKKNTQKKHANSLGKTMTEQWKQNPYPNGGQHGDESNGRIHRKSPTKNKSKRSRIPSWPKVGLEYLPIWMVDFYGKLVGKYSSPMELLGCWHEPWNPDLFIPTGSMMYGLFISIYRPIKTTKYLWWRWWRWWCVSFWPPAESRGQSPTKEWVNRCAKSRNFIHLP